MASEVESKADAVAACGQAQRSLGGDMDPLGLERNQHPRDFPTRKQRQPYRWVSRAGHGTERLGGDEEYFVTLLAQEPADR